MRHFYSFLLLAVLSSIAGTNAWAYDFVANGIFYNITSAEDLTVVVTSGTEKYSGDVNIPAVVENDGTTYSVTSIGNFAFDGCTGLTSIEIPSGVTGIGYNAFRNCSGLTSIEIPSSVTYISESAFYGCTGLTSIEIPSSVTSIGVQAFYGCTGLTSIEIPSSVTSIYNHAFQSCSGLTSVVVSSDNSVYDSRNNCNAIIETASNTLIAGCQNTVIPNSVTSIGNGAFQNCSGLTSIEIPSGVTSIGDYAFYGCTGLTSIEISSSVTSIGGSAFENCTGLTSIVIPSSVMSIGDYAFYGCTGLTSIEIPSSVTSIGNRAFQDCTGLTSIEIPSSVTSIGIYAFKNCSGLTSIEIPSSVTYISESAFYGCTGLTSIEIPSGVTRINGYAFYGCTGLTSIDIPSSVTSIGQNAFQGCIGLTSIEIPSGVMSIGQWAFYECTGLTSIVIGDGVTSIVQWAFADCTGLTSIEVASGNSVYDSRNNCNAIIRTASNTLIAGCKNTVIPSSVTSIGEYAFLGCTGLTSIEIPSSVTSIGNYAFKECTGLTSIEIPSSVTSIGEGAFSGCTGLTSIEIPSSVTSIGDYAFERCTGLKSIEIPSSVTSIGICAFSGCSGLTSIEIPSGVTSIGGSAFSNCTGLTSIEIPDGVTSIGQNAFSDCTGLTSIVIPSSVTSIGNNAFRSVRCVIYLGEATGSPWGAKKVYTTLPDEYGFYYADEEKTQIEFYAGKGGDVVIPEGVTSLPSFLFKDLKGITSVTIPASVTSVGDYAFQNCTGLTAIYLNCLVPPTINSSTFSGVDLSNCTLYVPEGFESKYKSANYWKDFTNIAVNPYVTVEKKAVIYVVDGEEYHRDSVIVTMGITAIDAPTREGYTFSGWSEIPATMPDNDVTVTGSFTVNTHNIIYVVDGAEYQKVENVAFGTTLVAIDAPTRDGYTFSGWSEIPATMPDNDVTVTGTFTVNTHNVIYVVDGAEYQKVENVAFGTTLAAIDAPTREGYTFSGWSEIPATMPDNDVTVTGTFTINKYAVIYMVDGEEYRRDSVEYGATITLAENPTKESHDFSGWSGYPEDLTMPAGDVIITGGFQFNGLAGVAAATSGDVYFDLTGKPLSQPQRGINLVRRADGATRKIIVR